MKRERNVYYYNSNQVGSTTALTKSDGKVVEHIAYDPYGKPTFFNASGSVIIESTVDNMILFTGREYEVESEIYYFRARNEHPVMGRFLQKDPLMYIDGFNDLSYAHNNPVNWVDLIGTESDPIGDYNKFMRQQQANKNYPHSKNLSKPSSTPKFGDLGIYNQPSHNSPTTNYPKDFGKFTHNAGNRGAKALGKNMVKKAGAGLAMRAPIAGAAAASDTVLPIGDIIGGAFLIGGIGYDLYQAYKEFYKPDCEND